MWQRWCLIACIAVCPGLCAGSSARNVSLPWTVTITTESLKQCLDFPNSHMKPFIKASVDFEQPMEAVSTPDDDLEKGHDPVPNTHYEELFFGGSHLLGLRRAHELNVEGGEAGVIKVGDFEPDARSEEAAAASSAIARLFLDLYRRRAALKYVEVSPEGFDFLVQELNRYGFRPAYVTPERPITALFVLNVRSNPTGKNADLIYGQ
ncbi:MAG: hypothetical protein JST89_11775 [Cyanobacteria bacterium SZAS-4]|nr:hypothetical protein [Cyanobacteria bacterium SZAS-4]